MFLKTSEQIERLAQYSRKQLWCVLSILLMLGIVDAVTTFVPRLHMSAAILVPVCIAIGVGSQRKARGIDFSSGSAAMRALQNDELRQQARSKAFRNGFFVLLAYPPLCAFTLVRLGIADPLPFLVASGAWLGAVVFLASLLWYDR